jgi:hypothetical protein
MFAKLKEYCGKHGDCLVPFRYKEDLTLAIWRVSNMWNRRNKIDLGRIARLESIGAICMESC